MRGSRRMLLTERVGRSGREDVVGLAALAVDTDPTPERDERERLDNIGPAITALNSVRCVALRAVIEYSLWVHRLGLSVDSRIPPEAEAVLLTHLDPEVDASTGVRSVYGQRLPWLISLDEDWVAEHLNVILPADDPIRRDAAWNAFILYTNPFSSGLRVLRDQYLLATQRLRGAVGSGWDEDEVRPRLAQHLLLFYLRGEIALDDALIGSYFANASDVLRAQALSFVGRIVGSEQAVPDEVGIRAMDLWKWRTRADASPSMETGELMSFGSWFTAKTLPVDWRLAELSRVLGETNGRIAHDREVVRALADVAEQHPAESMRLTTRLIRGDMEGWLASASTKSFSRMISAGVASGGQARAAGVDFANFLGAMGFREFRELV